MLFEKKEINKFNGYNSNVAPELLNDELGTARDIMNLRCERVGKLVTRNGYRIAQYGFKDKAIFPDPDYLYKRNGGVIGLGEFTQSHITSADLTDRYLVSYIRSISTAESVGELPLANEKDDIRKFPQIKNTAFNFSNREHLAAFVFSPIANSISGTNVISRSILQRPGSLPSTSTWYNGQEAYECDLDPQDGNTYKKLYASIRDLSVSSSNVNDAAINTCHRIHDVTSHAFSTDSIDKRYASFCQYRHKLIVSDKLNGDMAIENIWDSQTDKDEGRRIDGFRIRANCVEDFDINKVYLDARLLPNQENSAVDGVETGMALYQFELEKKTMVMSNPIDKGEATDPNNYKVYQKNPPDSKNYPDNESLKKTFFGLAETVMFSNITIAASDVASRVLNKHRIFTNADSNAQYADLLGNLSLTKFEYYDDKEDKQVKSNVANVYVWEDAQVKYYPSTGIDGLSVYATANSRMADQSTSAGNRLTNLEVQDGIGRKAPLGGWRYRFVWDYGNGDYSAPSTEIMCPDIIWSATKDNDVSVAIREAYKNEIVDTIGYQAVTGTEWDKFKANGFTNFSAGYNIIEQRSDGYYLSTIGKAIYDIKEKLYEGMRCKYGVFGTSGYDTSGKVIPSDPALPWESYNAGDFACNVVLKAPEHSVDLKGIIAQFAAFDCKDGTGPKNNIEDVYTIPTGFDSGSVHAIFATFKPAVPTFPYAGAVTGYDSFERFALMNGIFDYYGRYRGSYKNSRSAYNTFFLMPSYCDAHRLGENVSTSDTAKFYNSGLYYYGIFQNYNANHSNRFYLCLEAGMPDKYNDKYGFSDAHNCNRIEDNVGNSVNMYNKKPETLLRAYWNDNENPTVLSREVPAEVTNRLFIGGQAGLDITGNEPAVPFYPHIYGTDKPIVSEYINTPPPLTSGVSAYGWHNSIPESGTKSINARYYSTSIDSITVGSTYRFPGGTHMEASFKHLLILNTGNALVDGLYEITLQFRSASDDWMDIKLSRKLMSLDETIGIYFIGGGWSFSMIGNSGTDVGFLITFDSNTGIYSGLIASPVAGQYSYVLSPINRLTTNIIADYTTDNANKTEVTVYLPGHRLTLLEQLISIFPSGLLHKCPRVAIKVPNRFVPKKAKRLLVYRTLNSLSNEYDPKSYGLVKAIDIRRATGSEDINVCEEDTPTGVVYHNTIAGRPKQNDAITSSYSFSDTVAAGGDGGGDTDYYKGIYFFDDVRDSILDFTNNPDQYEALRYALKSAHNIAIGERVYYGNVIQQYQPEAPVGMEHKLHTNDSAVANISFITGKTSGTGVGDSNTWVSYAYLFEDEMTIKSQVETTGWLQLSENSSDTVKVGEMRDIALYFMPGPYTNGIKQISIYRKVLKGQAVPSSLSGEYKINDYFYVGEINNDIDTEGIFVDDGLPNGHLLPIVKVDLNDDDSWVFDTPPNTDEYESGVFWSEPYRPDVIKMENFMEFGSGDGSKITGLESQAGNIVVFKDTSIYRSAVQAENPPISRVDMVSRYEGCIAPNSLLNIEDMMYFLSPSGFMKYDNNVVTAADDAFHDELMFLLKSNESFSEEASAGYNQHFKEIYLNIPRVTAVVKVADTQEVNPVDEVPVSATVLGQTKCIVDTNDSDYYDTLEVQGADTIKPSFQESIFRREHYGHIFVINEHYQYTTKFAYPATTWKIREDNSSYFPIFVYHSLHLMRKYYTAENGVMYSGDIIPHWYGAADTKNSYKPALWAGVYAESPCNGDSALQLVDTNRTFGNTVYVQDSFPEMDMILDHRALNEIDANNAAYPCYPGAMLFPQVDSVEINSVYKSKFYTDGTETVLKRLRSAGVNIFAKNNIRILYTQFPVESVDSGIRYNPLPEIFLSTNNNGMTYSTIQARYNYPPTVNIFDKWMNNVIQGTGQNILYFIPDTRMANNRYKGTQVPFNDDIGKPTKFSIEIYTRGRVQLNALTYNTRNIWSYLR